MTTLSWWRSWHGAPTDLKWPVVAARAGVKVGIVSAIAWALMDYASQHKERGTVDGFDTEMYAVYSGFDETEIIAVINAMTDKGIIKDEKLTNWEKRQPKREDNSTPRVTKHREKKRNETQCNAPDTDTDTDTDIDTDTDEEYTPPANPSEAIRRLVGQFWGDGDEPTEVDDLIERFGIAQVEDMAKWCSQQKMRSMQQAIKSMWTMGPTWKKANRKENSLDVLERLEKEIDNGKR